MHASSPSIWTPARVVALALIAILVAGLAYVRLGTGSDPVSVPDGAKAGDLILEDCEYATEKGSYAADCGTLVVPENRADPESRLIAVPVTRIRARSESPAEPIFTLWGGPGLTNMSWPHASRYAHDHDVVMVGYRGVDGSSVLDCPEVTSALKHSTNLLDESSLRAYADGFASCAQRLKEEGVDVTGYGLVQQVEDMEAARTALGYDRINLLSESAGTRTALIYGWRYPETIHRSIMVGANPPGHYVLDVATTDEQMKRYAELCSKDAGCSARTDDLVSSIDDVAADLPDSWGPLPIKEGNVLVGSLFGFFESRPEAGLLSGPMMVDSWLTAAEGDPGGFWLLSFAADILLPESFVWGQYAAAGRVDAEAAAEYFAADGRNPESIADAGTTFSWGDGRLVDAWPASADEDDYRSVRDSEVETLLVGGTLDFAIPPQVATKELLPHLPNGQQVVIPRIGHTADFWSYQPNASSRLINTYFATGEVDDSLYRTPAVDFTPQPAHGVLAKGTAATMVALSLLVTLSLLLMARRVRRRGGFGRVSSALLRSVYPVVLGLGGWFLAVLIVITTMPGTPIDDRLLTVTSVGLPIALGVYCAWVQRDWTGKRKTAGLSISVLGALAGAWFGVTSAPGLIALFTGIGGAIAVANLALIIFDMTRARSVRNQFATTTTVDAPRPNVEPAMPAGVGWP
jgi:pimeloyl-ACP methyl ester carboxylesterase